MACFGVPAGAEGVAALPQRLTDAVGAGDVGADRVDQTAGPSGVESGGVAMNGAAPCGGGRYGGGSRGVVRTGGQEMFDGIEHLAQTVGAGRPCDDRPGWRGRGAVGEAIALGGGVLVFDGVEQPRRCQHVGQRQPHHLARLCGLAVPGGGGTGRGLRFRPLFDGAVPLAAGGRQAGLHPVQFGLAMVTRGHDRGVLLADAVLDGDEAGAFAAVLRLDPYQGVSFGAEVAGRRPPAAGGAAPVVDGSSQSVEAGAAAVQNR